MMGESSQKSIKIDENLWDELDLWFKTSRAKKLGYHSKAQFATEAIRELMEKYDENKKIAESIKKYYKKTPFHNQNVPLTSILRYFLDDYDKTYRIYSKE